MHVCHHVPFFSSIGIPESFVALWTDRLCTEPMFHSIIVEVFCNLFIFVQPEVLKTCVVSMNISHPESPKAPLPSVIGSRPVSIQDEILPSIAFSSQQNEQILTNKACGTRPLPHTKSCNATFSVGQPEISAESLGAGHLQTNSEYKQLFVFGSGSGSWLRGNGQQKLSSKRKANIAFSSNIVQHHDVVQRNSKQVKGRLDCQECVTKGKALNPEKVSSEKPRRRSTRCIPQQVFGSTQMFLGYIIDFAYLDIAP